MKQSRPVTEPTKCRSCKMDVLWAQWASGKKMPVDAVSDNRQPPKGGDLVLTLRGGEYGELLVEKYDPGRHGQKRNRYTSHFATCGQADDWRRE